VYVHKALAALPSAAPLHFTLSLCGWVPVQLCKLLASQFAYGLPHVLRLVSKDGEEIVFSQQRAWQLAPLYAAPGRRLLTVQNYRPGWFACTLQVLRH
jgi:hypothetical protein